MLNLIKDRIIFLNRKTKQFIAAVIDLIIIFFSFILTGLLDSSQYLDISSMNDYLRILLFSFICIFIFHLNGIYLSILRYINLLTLLNLIKGFFVSLILISFLLLVEITLRGDDFFLIFNYRDSIFIIFPILLSLTSLLILRIFANFFFSIKSGKNVVIYGAGSAGIQLANALLSSKEMDPLYFIDKDEDLHNSFVAGIRVLKPSKLRKIILSKSIDEVLIAMPSLSRNKLGLLLKEIEELAVKVRILPGVTEIAQGKVSISSLKEIDYADLLGRVEASPDENLIGRNIKNKVILITGAGGSIGSEITRQVAKNKPNKVIILDSNEYALFSIQNEISKNFPEINLFPVLASIKNKSRITEVCKVFSVQTIYHAAAYKHVPIVEENPFEAVSNNIFGTKICAESAIEAKVETFVLISTDKAVRPTNIMGATKRFAELILQSLATKSETKMTMVRFGNVIGSSGSAIPLFQKQIKEGGPVTVTHPEVIRYFMSIPEAAELVIQAGAMGEGGDVFVLDMGEPVKIAELAKRLINLSGMELIEKDNPEGDIAINYTGLRPGEKLYEELLIGDEVNSTDHKRILKAKEKFLTHEELNKYLYLLEEAEKEGDIKSLKEILEEAIEGFTPEKEIVDVLHLQRK